MSKSAIRIAEDEAIVSADIAIKVRNQGYGVKISLHNCFPVINSFDRNGIFIIGCFEANDE